MAHGCYAGADDLPLAVFLCNRVRVYGRAGDLRHLGRGDLGVEFNFFPANIIGVTADKRHTLPRCRTEADMAGQVEKKLPPKVKGGDSHLAFLRDELEFTLVEVKEDKGIAIPCFVLSVLAFPPAHTGFSAQSRR